MTSSPAVTDRARPYSRVPRAISHVLPKKGRLPTDRVEAPLGVGPGHIAAERTNSLSQSLQRATVVSTETAASMRRVASIILALTSSLALACAAPGAAAIPGPDDAIAVSGAVQDRLKAADINVRIVEEKPYAIAFWSAGKNYAAGEALAKKEKSGWTIVKITGAKFTDSMLLALGVPDSTAKALVADLAVADR